MSMMPLPWLTRCTGTFRLPPHPGPRPARADLPCWGSRYDTARHRGSAAWKRRRRRVAPGRPIAFQKFARCLHAPLSSRNSKPHSATLANSTSESWPCSANTCRMRSQTCSQPRSKNTMMEGPAPLSAHPSRPGRAQLQDVGQAGTRCADTADGSDPRSRSERRWPCRSPARRPTARRAVR